MKNINKNISKVPKLRFPKFNDAWQEDIIESHFDFKNGINKGKEFFGHGSPIVNFKDVYNLIHIKKDDINGKIEITQSEYNRYSAKKGDLFFTRTSETPNDIGMSSVLIEDIPNTIFSGFVLRARPKNKYIFNTNFLGYRFRTWQIRKEIVTKSSFTTRALTSGTLLNKVFLIILIFKSNKK